MSKVLKIVSLLVATLFLTTSLAFAQAAPEPGVDAGKTPTSSTSTTHKGKGKKHGKKKGGKKKGGKKTATEPAK